MAPILIENDIIYEERRREREEIEIMTEMSNWIEEMDLLRVEILDAIQ